MSGSHRVLPPVAVWAAAVLLATGAMPAVAAEEEAATAEKAATAEVRALERERYAATIAGDWDRLADLLADGLVFTHANGAVQTGAAFLADLRSGRLRYDRIDLEDVEARRFDGAGVVTGLSRLGLRFEGKPRTLVVRFTSTWVRMADGWRLVAYQSTRAPEAAVPEE